MVSRSICEISRLAEKIGPPERAVCFTSSLLLLAALAGILRLLAGFLIWVLALLAGFLIWILALLARLLIWILILLAAALVWIVWHRSTSTWVGRQYIPRAAWAASKDREFQESEFEQS